MSQIQHGPFLFDLNFDERVGFGAMLWQVDTEEAVHKPCLQSLHVYPPWQGETPLEDADFAFAEDECRHVCFVDRRLAL